MKTLGEVLEDIQKNIHRNHLVSLNLHETCEILYPQPKSATRGSGPVASQKVDGKGS